ncbi:MAG: hypothetical protein KAS62_01920, partial [Candidatus Delongbacteria bacterium]|nr:hypothetical protein [Candidatus Delongbacteria bacterium]
INKSGKPLEIEMEGVSNKGIEFKYDFKTTVETSAKTEAEFFVNPITTEQDSRGTHPKICTNIKINGKLAEFISGIVPKFPLYVDLLKEAEFTYVGQEGEMFLNCESFLDEKALFEFDLSNGTEIEFEEPKVSFELNAHEKTSIPVKYKINKGQLYTNKTKIKATLEAENTMQQGNTIEFTETIVNRAYSHSSEGFQETENQYEVNMGKYSVNILKKRYQCSSAFHDRERNGQNIYFLQPKLGKPFTVEFDRREADKVECSEEGNSKVMKAYYSSLEKKDVNFAICYKLYENGIMEKWIEFTNNKQDELDNNFIYCDRFVVNRENIIMPYDGKVLKVQAGVDQDFNNFDGNKISENWIYSGNSKKSAGITWPEEYKLKIIDWHFSIEHSLEGLKPNETMVTKPVVFFLNTFDLENFRKFVFKKKKPKDIIVTQTTELLVNDQNPFVKDNVSIQLKDYKTKPLIVDLSVSSIKGSFETKSVQAKLEDKLSAIKTDIVLGSKTDLELINCDIRYKIQQENLSKAVFPIGNEDIKCTESVEKGKKVLSVKNGSLCFKTSPDFAPNIFSLKQNETEWIDSSFPQTCSKSWWTPWFGGLFLSFDGLSEKELIEEKHSAEFVKIEDNFKNKWEGIKISTKIEKKDDYKGISVEQFYLTLPGTPVVVNFNKINNNSNKYMNKSYYKLLFFKGNGDLKDHYWTYINNDKNKCNYYNGLDCTDIRVGHDEVHSLNYVGTKNKISFLHPKRMDYIAICTNEVTIPKITAEQFNIKNGDSFVSNYEFMIFSDKELNFKELEDLKNIKFEV